jgi:hypothetical protein
VLVAVVAVPATLAWRDMTLGSAALVAARGAAPLGARAAAGTVVEATPAPSLPAPPAAALEPACAPEIAALGLCAVARGGR